MSNKVWKCIVVFSAAVLSLSACGKVDGEEGGGLFAKETTTTVGVVAGNTEVPYGEKTESEVVETGRKQYATELEEVIGTAYEAINAMQNRDAEKVRLYTNFDFLVAQNNGYIPNSTEEAEEFKTAIDHNNERLMQAFDIFGDFAVGGVEKTDITNFQTYINSEYARSAQGLYKIDDGYVVWNTKNPLTCMFVLHINGEWKADVCINIDFNFVYDYGSWNGVFPEPEPEPEVTTAPEPEPQPEPEPEPEQKEEKKKDEKKKDE